jgi:hypothetical protein
MRTIKTLIIIFLFGVSAHAQTSKENETEIFSIISKSIGRDIALPWEILKDSCYQGLVFIKVDFNKNAKMEVIQISDNAPSWQREEFNKSLHRGKIDTVSLDKVAKKNGLKNCQIVFPFIISSLKYPCNQIPQATGYNYMLYEFGGKRLKGNVIFAREIEIGYSEPKI